MNGLALAIRLAYFAAILSIGVTIHDAPDDSLPKLPTPAEQREMDAANLPLRQRPTMDALISMATTGREDRREYYAKLLQKALEVTGPIHHNLIESQQRIYAASSVSLSMYGGHGSYGYRGVSSSFAVLIPAQFLPAIGKDERGDGFPRGVPFRMIKGNP